MLSFGIRAKGLYLQTKEVTCCHVHMKTTPCLGRAIVGKVKCQTNDTLKREELRHN